MTTLAPDDVVGVDNPRLTTFIATRGYLTAPVSLEYQIWDRTTNTPAQVYPLVVGTRASVDLVTDIVSAGQYAASWTVPNDATDGRYEIRWFATIEDGESEMRWSRMFDVRADALINPGRASYALVSDVRAEGTFPNVTDERIQDALLSASELIDAWTGRSFVPIQKDIRVNGTSKSILVLGEPICAIDDVRFDRTSSAINRDAYRVFARHLTDNLRDPDDRESPALQFVAPYVYPDELWPDDGGGTYSRSPYAAREFHKGTQNIVVSGVFGYTEFDGSPVGATPRAVRRACVLLALRQIFPQTSSQGWMQQNEAFITEKRTREQSIKTGGAAQGGGSGGMLGPVGDPEIDRLIMTVMPALRGTGC
jgi:hypothetical protein